MYVMVPLNTNVIGFIISHCTWSALFASYHFSLVLFISFSLSHTFSHTQTVTSFTQHFVASYSLLLLHLLLSTRFSHTGVCACNTGKPSPSVIWFIGNEKIDDTYTVDHTTGNTVNEVSISPSALSSRLLLQFNQLQEKYLQERHLHSSSYSGGGEVSMSKKLASNSDDIFTIVNALPFLQITCQVYLDAILFPASPPISTSLRFDTNCK